MGSNVLFLDVSLMFAWLFHRWFRAAFILCVGGGTKFSNVFVQVCLPCQVETRWLNDRGQDVWRETSWVLQKGKWHFIIIEGFLGVYMYNSWFVGCKPEVVHPFNTMQRLKVFGECVVPIVRLNEHITLLITNQLRYVYTFNSASFNGFL